MGALIDSSGKLVDVGSGAGFPGLVLKIFYPDLEVCLVESVKKKPVSWKKLFRHLV